MDATGENILCWLFWFLCHIVIIFANILCMMLTIIKYIININVYLLYKFKYLHT